MSINACKWNCKHKPYYQCLMDINNGVYKCNLDKMTKRTPPRSLEDFMLNSNKIIYSKTNLENNIYNTLDW